MEHGSVGNRRSARGGGPADFLRRPIQRTSPTGSTSLKGHPHNTPNPPGVAMVIVASGGWSVKPGTPAYRNCAHSARVQTSYRSYNRCLDELCPSGNSSSGRISPSKPLEQSLGFGGADRVYPRAVVRDIREPSDCPIIGTANNIPTSTAGDHAGCTSQHHHRLPPLAFIRRCRSAKAPTG